MQSYCGVSPGTALIAAKGQEHVCAAGGSNLGRHNRSTVGRQKRQARQASTADRAGDTTAMFDSERDFHESAQPARTRSPYQDLR